MEQMANYHGKNFRNLTLTISHFTRQTENFRHSYAGITAALLNATYHTTSWSGKGMVRNYGDKKTVSVDPVPKFFTNTIANQPKHQWDFSKYIPDVVVIALGTNDFSTAPRPSYAEYGGAYNKLLDLLRAKYGPNTKIFCMSGPLKLQFVDRVVAERKDKNVFFANTANLLKADDWGCDGHPNAKGAAKMANVLAGIIKNAK
jgi:lysophospholipase L1-like esterase